MTHLLPCSVIVLLLGKVIDRTMDLVLQMGREVASAKNAHEKLFSLFNMHLHVEVSPVPADFILVPMTLP